MSHVCGFVYKEVYDAHKCGTQRWTCAGGTSSQRAENKKDVIFLALQEYVTAKKKKNLLDLKGAIEGGGV